ncbi:aldehyde dehydrogenase family protein [Microbacterium sp. SLBN-111]|uniref:aldehyde dehydrogenase family protein n=1 Tax=Microbacterium sp. SLBN-111 TaxID=3377733 RepID=UPI003C78021A
MTTVTTTVTDLVDRIRAREYSMTIDGRAVSGADRFAVDNPSTGETLATAPRCSDDELDRAVRSAHAAFPRWRGDIVARRAVLHRIADVLVANQEVLGTLVTLEQGKPRAEGVGDVLRSADWFRHFAEVDLGDRVVQDDENGFVEVVHRPLGVVAGIIPWNQPMLMISWKTAPALLAGNTVVLKPSSSTPLTALLFGELVREIVPAGVLAVISGPEPLGSKLIDHELVRKVSFTGSTAVGMGIAQKTASSLKRLTLELGGNDAAIVLDDAEPEEFAEQLFWAAMKNNGQMCALIKRLYVPERRRASYTEAFADLAGRARVGDPLLDGTQLGPLATPAQFRGIRDLASATAAQGATIAAGGAARDGAGYFFPPTVVTDVAENSAIVADEQFGPILPVVGYDDVEEAVARANGTDFGLAGSVWGADLERAREIASRFESGQASVNHHTRGILPHLPFGGAKHSGIGYENGSWGLEAFTQLQTLAGPARHA